MFDTNFSSLLSKKLRVSKCLGICSEPSVSNLGIRNQQQEFRIFFLFQRFKSRVEMVLLLLPFILFNTVQNMTPKLFNPVSSSSAELAVLQFQETSKKERTQLRYRVQCFNFSLLSKIPSYRTVKILNRNTFPNVLRSFLTY